MFWAQAYHSWKDSNPLGSFSVSRSNFRRVFWSANSFQTKMEGHHQQKHMKNISSSSEISTMSSKTSRRPSTEFGMEVCGQPFRNTLPPSYPIYQTPLWQGYQCSPLQLQHRRLDPNNSWGPTGISTPTHPLQACYWFPTKFSLGSVQSADMFRSASWLQGHHVLAELSGHVSGGSKGVINFQEVIKRFVIAFVTPSDAMNFFFQTKPHTHKKQKS